MQGMVPATIIALGTEDQHDIADKINSGQVSTME